ncbi:DNA-methyltransferase [Metabacillus sp. Hm71]|uniref:DNA-methyltransferase n=1 Tax=Metabacillus sp. Hm71 TaxID=3450743 RepID=UPI003F43906B
MLKNEWLNKIYKHDCIDAMSKLPNECVDLILTDIPYGNVSKNGEERAKYDGQLRKLDKGAADVLTFDLHEFLEECYRLSKGTIYIFCGKEQVSEVFSYFSSKKDGMTRQCIWHKTNPSPSNGQHMWLDAIENCVFFKKRKQTFNEHCKHNVWNFPVGRSKRHPTEKPLKLFEYLIETSTNEGDIVLDPCIGSGTTAEACINLHRKFIGIEINEEYHKIANERIHSII